MTREMFMALWGVASATLLVVCLLEIVMPVAPFALPEFVFQAAGISVGAWLVLAMEDS